MHMAFVRTSALSENLSKIYRKSIEHLLEIYRFGVDLGWIWGGSGVTLGSLGVILGPLLAYEGDFGVSSEPFRRRKALDGDFDAYVCGLGGAKK